MTYTLGEATEVTGRSRATILRALQTGKVAATHDEATDEWAIEPDDLFRIFPVAYHIRFVLEAIEPLRNEIRELRSRLDALAAELVALKVVDNAHRRFLYRHIKTNEMRHLIASSSMPEVALTSVCSSSQKGNELIIQA